MEDAEDHLQRRFVADTLATIARAISLDSRFPLYSDMIEKSIRMEPEETAESVIKKIRAKLRAGKE